MHFSFSPERYSESKKYREDIKHDASIIENAYKEDKNQGLFDLTHKLTTGKQSEMKLMTFDFSYSSGIQYLMSTRNVRNEMIRVLQTENTPQGKEIITKLNKDIVSQRDNDMKFYSRLDENEKTRKGNIVDARENYRNLVNEYPSETAKTDIKKTESRVPIQIDLNDTANEYSPFLESETTVSKNLDRN